MPLRYLLDENLRGPLWRAIQRHNARGDDPIDVVRVGDVPQLPLGSPDAEILRWAEQTARILVTLDRSTMQSHLNDHLGLGRHSPGIFSVRRGGPISDALEFLALAAYASEPEEWADRVEYL